jgi:hypothetical protein
MQRTKASRLAQAAAAPDGNIFAVMGMSVVESRREKTPASASVSKVGVADNRAGRPAITLVGGVAALCACVALPTLAHAQAGEGSIAVAPVGLLACSSQ